MREEVNDMFMDAESFMAMDELDIDFIIESIKDQVSNLFESDSKKNYLKVFENKLDDTELDSEEKTNIRDTVYNEIIDIISDRFNIQIDRASISNRILAKNLYKFFIINYTENVAQFLEMYIVENMKLIVSELEKMEINSRRIEGIQSRKIAIILNNISFVIDIINSSNIDFREFLTYINRHPESKSSTEELLDYLDEVIEYTDEIMEFIMKQLTNEEEGFSNIYTELQRRLFNRYNSIT